MSQNKKNSEPKLISGPFIPTLAVVHEDDRRTIRETQVKNPDGTISRITHLAIKGAGVLGNHYHLSGEERFTVISGEPTVVTAPHEKPEESKMHTFPNGGYIVMQPGETHAFYFDKPGNLISSMDSAFNPDDPDMHPQQLPLPSAHSAQHDPNDIQ